MPPACPCVEECRRGRILQTGAGRIEQGDLLRRRSPRLSPGDQLAELAMHVRARHRARRDGMVQIAHLFALVEPVGDDQRARHQLGRDLTLRRL